MPAFEWGEFPDVKWDDLPEANATFEAILRDFLEAVRRAATLDDVNIAAGIAHQRLEQ